MSESIEEIAKKEDPKILPHITGSKPASTNLLKINKRAHMGKYTKLHLRKANK